MLTRVTWRLRAQPWLWGWLHTHDLRQIAHQITWEPLTQGNKHPSQCPRSFLGVFIHRQIIRRPPWKVSFRTIFIREILNYKYLPWLDRMNTFRCAGFLFLKMLLSLVRIGGLLGVGRDPWITLSTIQSNSFWKTWVYSSGNNSRNWRRLRDSTRPRGTGIFLKNKFCHVDLSWQAPERKKDLKASEGISSPNPFSTIELASKYARKTLLHTWIS